VKFAVGCGEGLFEPFVVGPAFGDFGLVALLLVRSWSRSAVTMLDSLVESGAVAAGRA
jgi:hypothetical protein